MCVVSRWTSSFDLILGSAGAVTKCLKKIFVRFLVHSLSRITIIGVTVKLNGGRRQSERVSNGPTNGCYYCSKKIVIVITDVYVAVQGWGIVDALALLRAARRQLSILSSQNIHIDRLHERFIAGVF